MKVTDMVDEHLSMGRVYALKDMDEVLVFYEDCVDTLLGYDQEADTVRIDHIDEQTARQTVMDLATLINFAYTLGEKAEREKFYARVDEQ